MHIATAAIVIAATSPSTQPSERGSKNASRRIDATSVTTLPNATAPSSTARVDVGRARSQARAPRSLAMSSRMRS